MAPFFLTLALFFGALVLWMVLRPLQNRAIAAEVKSIRVVLASYLPARGATRVDPAKAMRGY